MGRTGCLDGKRPVDGQGDTGVGKGRIVGIYSYGRRGGSSASPGVATTDVPTGTPVITRAAIKYRQPRLNMSTLLT